jgi:uncharacterized protein
VAADVAEQQLVDHHCHGVLLRAVSEADLEAMLTEGGPFPGGSVFDSGIGFAFRRLCPPVLGLPAFASLADYVSRRAELGVDEAGRAFLRACGLSALCVDTGFIPEPITPLAALEKLAGAPAYEIVRLEAVAEAVTGVSADGFADAVRAALSARCASPGVVGLKSIAAYRTGLELDPDRPSSASVAAAAGRYLAAPGRIADPVLQRFLIWCGADLGLPVQFHIGYGDNDVDLHRCNPLLLTPLIRALPVPVMLLHNYPYHREAGYLAQVFPQVYVDLGLATHNVGARAKAVLAEALELAPYGKVLYSSDAFGLPELYYLAAALFRGALGEVLADLPAGEAERVARLICAENAQRVYRLGPANNRNGR